MTDSPPLLSLTGVSKSFGGVQALKDVDFTLRAGEIHGLIGENGAGKSTLMKIIAGVHASYTGTMAIDGKPVQFRSTRDALAAGIGMVHQELSIAPDLTVAENVFLGAQPVNRFGVVDWAGMHKAAREQLVNLGLDIDTRMPAGSLPIGIQQLVELSRVLFSGARIIILDEPTSALSPPETERLFAVLRKLRESGRSIVFISHFLDDILRISDTITIFRNGRKVVTAPVTAETDKGWIIERMIGSGREDLEESWLSEITLTSPKEAPVVMETEALGFGTAFDDISLKVRGGEVLGIYGFMGCGQIELARSLFGKIAPDRGRILVEGAPTRLANTATAKRAGIAYVPESRRDMLFADLPIYKNISISILEHLSRLFLKPAREREIAAGHIRTLSIKAPGPDTRLGSLSGGNQQKVALARWLTRPPRVLILSEPTRGMDVGAKEDVVHIVRSLKERGIAVVVVSTEPETVLSMADRILVLRRGTIAEEFTDTKITKDQLLAAA
ncbi:sugar ABC transporter ATP-binding protein [Prosthecomicrobium sp. N25]|uniref:sugar ABC transporter ATP-binding protein n=1 Tax=Prosthecomicrobium sp. N25 TaxID=3129254 RepID=UPI0030780655